MAHKQHKKDPPKHILFKTSRTCRSHPRTPSPFRLSPIVGLSPTARPPLPFCTFEPPTMVRTRGGHRFRLRVQTCTLSRDGAGTSGATTCHSPTQGAEAPPDLSPSTALMQSPASNDMPEEPRGAEPPSRRYNTRVGPRPPLLCIHGLHRGYRLPSGPGHLARGSLHVLGLSLRGLQLHRAMHCHRLSYPLLRGLRIHYFIVTRYPVMWIVLPRTFTKSPTMIYRHWQQTHGSEILCGWSTGILCCHL